MAVTHADLIEAAQVAESAAANEAEFRGVCSRAYYAIFQDGQAFHFGLPTQGNLPADFEGGMHARLIQQLITPGISRSDPLFFKSMSIGYLMKSLYAKRIKADYYRELDMDKPTAGTAISEATKIIAAIKDTHPPSPTPPASATQPQSEESGTAKSSRPTLHRIK